MAKKAIDAYAGIPAEPNNYNNVVVSTGAWDSHDVVATFHGRARATAIAFAKKYLRTARKNYGPSAEVKVMNGFSLGHKEPTEVYIAHWKYSNGKWRNAMLLAR